MHHVYMSGRYGSIRGASATVAGWIGGGYGTVSFTIDYMFYWYSHFLRVIYHFNLMGHKFLPEIK